MTMETPSFGPEFTTPGHSKNLKTPPSETMAGWWFGNMTFMTFPYCEYVGIIEGSLEVKLPTIWDR